MAIDTTSSPAHAWLRALQLTKPIAGHPQRTLPTAIEEAAVRFGNRPALLSDRECLTYRALSERLNQYARWAMGENLRKGDVVCLLMPNRPEYMAIWLGLTSVGVVVSLLNTHIAGESLAHCIRSAAPRYIVAAAECAETLTAALSRLDRIPEIRIHGAGPIAFSRIDLELAGIPGERFERDEQSMPVIEDRALYIYTSGTTGLPKAAIVSHARVMQWTHWFAGMMQVTPEDRMYDCLPMYHSVGGVQAPGAILVAGGTVAIREKFSATHFWNDILRWDCTVFQYIGELCRYLLQTPASANETAHRIRLACGNGMAREVWDAFKERFRIPRILEFYAATEGAVSLFNVEGKPGAIGHIPSYLAHRFSPVLVKLDVASGEPMRNDQGFCMRCTANEAGEAISAMTADSANVGSRFEGYTNRKASERKILRNVFKAGDAWIRTGDLMRKDEKGYFYFVDRIGDTFRWKGENVATSEVAEAVCAFPGVKHAAVYGVSVPGAEGRAGMAAVVMESEPNLAELRKHLANRLPGYARPLFLRIRKDAAVTGTMKYSKTDLVRSGFDPCATLDPIYFNDAASDAFALLDKRLFDRIQSGEIRL